MTSTIPPIPLAPSEVGQYVANKHIISLYKASDAYKHKGQHRIFHSWVCQLGQIDVRNVHMNSLFSKAKYLYTQYCKLKKSKHSDFSEFQNMEFKFPTFKNVIQRKRRISEETGVEGNCKECAHEMKKVKLTLKELQNLKRVSNQSIKRKQEIIGRLRQKYNRIRVQTKTSVSCDAKTNEVENKVYVNKSVQCNILDRSHMKKIQLLRKELSRVQNEQCIMLEDQQDRHTIETQTCERGKPFLASVRNVCYDFLSAGFSSDKIPSLICSVINNLTSNTISVSQLPSPSSINKMCAEISHVCRQHVSDSIAGEDNIAIMRDGTTKKGHHLYGVKIATENDILTVGLREHASSTSDTLFNLTKTIFNDIGKSSEQDCDFIYNVFSSISSTMTDRCATEIRINKLLKEFKENCLKTVIEDFSDLPDEEKNSLLEIHEFKCAVHPLLQFSSECDKVVRDVEKLNGIQSKIIGTKGESSCQTLLRGVSKLLYKDGTGDPSLIHAFLLDAGITTIPILNFKGNRFNILFHNALGLFSIKEHILKYLENTKMTLNFIQDNVLKGLKDIKLMEICRALGIICVSITSPYWKFASEVNVSAIEMYPVYQDLVLRLEKWQKDVRPLMLGEESLCVDFKPVDGDNAFLFTGIHSEEFLGNILQKMCEAMLTKARVLFSDFLSGERYNNPSEEVVKQTLNCPQNNISLERLMAQVDRSIIKCPNSNMSTRESKIMYVNNGTSQWLDSKSVQEKEEIIKNALKGKSQILADERIRKRELKTEYLEIIKNRQAEKKKKEQRASETRNKLMRAIIDSGYWMSEEEIDRNLINKTKTQQLNSLKNQINGRKKLLGQKVTDKSLFAFSRKGEKFTVDKLRLNLISLINIHICDDIDNEEVTINVEDIRQQPISIVPRYIHHTWTDDGREKVWLGRIISYIPSKKMYKIAYWDDCLDDEEEDATVYEMTVKEVLTDVLDGSLKFL